MLGTALKRWSWLENGLVPLAALLMDVTWAYPLLSLFLRDATTGALRPGFTFWLCLGVLLGGTVAGRLASQNRLAGIIVVVGGFAAISISLLLVFPIGAADLDVWLADLADQIASGRPGQVVPAPLFVGVSSMFLWWRGVRIASAEHSETAGSFAVGVVALAGLLVLSLVLPPAPLVPQGSEPVVNPAATGMAPLGFLASIPAAIVFAILSRFLGNRAATLSQLSLVIGLLFLGSTVPFGPEPRQLIGWILVFLASGLVSLSLLGVSGTLQEQETRIGVRLHIDRHWLVAMLSVVLGVLIVGLLIGQIIAPETVLFLVNLFRPIWTLIGRILFLILVVFAYLFFSLLEPLLAQIENRPRQDIPAPWASPVQPDATPGLAGEPLKLPPIFGQIVHIILILGLVALVAWVFYLAMRKREGRGQIVRNDVLETREIVLSADLLRDQLRGLLDGLRRRGPPPLFLPPGPPGDPRRIIRELYQKILAQAIELELPRRKGQTPYMYRDSLLRLFPGERAYLETLTRAYIRARYGILPPSVQDVQSAQDAFAHIDAAMQAKAKEFIKY